MSATHSPTLATAIPIAATRTATPSMILLLIEPRDRSTRRLRARALMSSGKGTGVPQQARLAQRTLGAFAQRGLLTGDSGPAGAARSVDLDPDPVGGDLGDVDLRRIERLE